MTNYNYYGMAYKMSKFDDLLTRFSESNAKEMEYKYAESDYANTSSACNSTNAAIKRFGKKGLMKASIKEGKVIIKKTF